MLSPNFGAAFLILCLNFLYVTCNGAGNSVYVIDITGSMRNVTEQVISHVREVQSNGAANAVLVTFNNRDVRVRAVTNHETELNEALSSILVYGGGKCPENSLSGLIEGLKHSLPNSYIYVFTDASAKDYYKVEKITDLCMEKQPQINFILTGNCGDSSSKQFQVYYDIAEKCNGRVILINYSDVREMLALLTPYSRVTPVPFHLDDKTDFALINAFRDVVDIVVTRDDFGKPSTEKLWWIQNVKKLKVLNTVPGNYIAWVKGAGHASVQLFPKANFTFEHGFSDFVPTSLADASKQPFADKNQHLIILVTDPDHRFRIERANILTLKEKVLMTIYLKHVSGDFYITEKFVPPNSSFLIQVRATNKQTGKSFFISRTIIEPIIEEKAPIVSISKGSHIAINYDSSVELTCSVSAYPEPAITWLAGGSILRSTIDFIKPPYNFVSHLRLQNVTKSLNYECRAKNKLGHMFSGIQINVISPFKVIKDLPVATKSEYGQDVTLNCLIKHNPELKTSYEWYFKDINGTVQTVINSSMVYFNHTSLTIKSIDIDREGEYSYVIWITSDHAVNKTCTTNVKINNLEIPEVSLNSEKITILEHNNTKIYCRITKGVPRPTIKWEFQKENKKDLVRLKTSDEYLIIEDVSFNNSGNYICTATNILGSGQGQTELTVTKAPEAWILGESPVLVEYGSSHEFTCKVIAHPPPIIVWNDQLGNVINTTQIDLIDPPYNFVSHLRLQNITNSQKYICQAKNELGNMFNSILIDVISPFKVIKDLPVATKSEYGQEVTLNCLIKHNPELKTSYEWYFKDINGTVQTVINSSMVYFNHTSLTIKSMDIDREGEYSYIIWITSDHAVNKTCTTNVKINNLEIPEVSLNSEKIIITEHYETNISCKITKGVPRPTIKWEFQKEDKKDLILLKTSDEALIIRDVALNNSGNYICTATNILGTGQGRTELTVTKAPEVWILGESLVLVVYGSTHEFTCKVIAHPPPRIVWKDQLGNVMNTTQVTANGYESSSRLTLSNIRNSSQYTCHAENDVGYKNKTVFVSPNSPFKVNSVPVLPFYIGRVFEETIKVKYGKLVKLFCNVTSDLPIERAWFSDKVKELSLKGITVEGNKAEEFIISSMDVHLQGTYGCKVWLASKPDVFIEQKTTLEIDDLSSPSIVATQYFSNQTFTASCVAKGTPKPTITWYHKEGEDLNKLDVTGEELKLDNFKLNRTGFYVCKADNGVGSSDEQFYLKFDEIHKGLVGDSLLKTGCQYIGNDPNATLVWKTSDNNVVISDSKHDLKHTSNAIYLSIKNPSQNDTGYFICEVKADVGNLFLIFETFVTENFENYTKFYGDINSIFITENDSKNIECRLSHLDSTNVRWYKNGQLKDVIESYYPIREASESDDGNYTCRVNQEHGPVSATYAVKVGPKLTFNTTYDLSTKFWSGNDDDFVDCSLKSSKPLEPNTKVEWSYNGKKTNIEGYKHPVVGWGQYTCKVSNDFGDLERSINVTTDGCLIKRKIDMDNHPPLIITFDVGVESKQVLYFNAVSNYTNLEIDQEMRISCYSPHNKNHFNVYLNKEYLTIKCLWEDKFVINDQVYKYSDIKCEKPVEVIINNTNRTCTHDNSELINIGFDTKSGGFIETYKVCFDNKLNVPAFAYSEMSLNNLGNQVDYNKWVKIPSYQGVISTDCDNESKCCYGKEQLVNAVDVTFGPPQAATFYDYNAVGVWKPCGNDSRMSWKMIEENVRKLLYTYKNIDVWSGASGYEQKIIGMVPRYLWKAIGSHGVIVYVNDPNPKLEDIKCSAPIETLSPVINDDQFTYSCSIDEFSDVFNITRNTFEYVELNFVYL